MKHNVNSFRIALLLIIASGTILTTGCRTPAKHTFPYTTEAWIQDGHVGRRISTEHYEIFSTVDDAEFESALPAFMETAHARYRETISNDSPTDEKMTIYLFQTRQEWAVFSRRRFPQRFPVYTLIRSGGFTDGTVAVLFFVERASTFATLAHEGWHQYAASRFANLPAWLNEGLACTFETFRWNGDEVIFEPHTNTFRLNSLREAIQTDSLITLCELLATNAGEVVSLDDSRFTQSYYAQAWALVTFLRCGENGKWSAGFERLRQEIADGSFKVRIGAQQLAEAREGRTHHAEALARVYFNTSEKELEESFRAYVLDLSRLTDP